MVLIRAQSTKDIYAIQDFVKIVSPKPIFAHLPTVVKLVLFLGPTIICLTR
jgi:hypothetical protein